MKSAVPDSYYQRLFPISSKDFNLCFYCGCEATEQDFCPPKHLAASVIFYGEQCDWLVIPACYECHALLHNQRKLTLEARFTTLKKRLEKKYHKALHVYRVWQDDELDDMSAEFAHSIKGGMRLGEEASGRLAYKGFKYECDGQGIDFTPVARAFSVAGEIFTSFDAALEYCITRYALDRGVFYNYLTDKCGGDFDLALKPFVSKGDVGYDKVERDEIAQFCRKHNQRRDFVERSCTTLIRRDPSLDIAGALDYLYAHYICKK